MPGLLLYNLILGTVLLVLCVPVVSSQDKLPAGTTSKRATEQKEIDEVRSNAILLAQGLTNKLAAFTDSKAKAIAIARIAGQMWKVDEAFARSLFEKALQITRPANSNDAATLRVTRNTVVALIAQRDNEWAQRLIDQLTETDSGKDLKARSSLEIATALRLMEENDVDSATAFAQRSIADQLNVQPQLEFLLRLRKTNEPVANQLFLQVLNHFSRIPNPDVRALHTFGVYLFTAPSLLDSDKYSVTLVDKILVPNITAKRPGIPESLVRAYLSTAATVLWRTLDSPDHQYAYTLGFLLVPKAKIVAPDLATQIEGAMAAVSSRVPQNLTTEAAYKYINAPPLSSEESLARAEQKTDQESKDIAYFDIAASAWFKGDYKLARIANAKISNLEVSRKLGSVIDFAEASDLLRSNPGQADEAQRMGERLEPGVEKAMLFLSLAKAREKSGEIALAEEAVDIALKATPAISDTRRPFLLLLSAAQLASLKSSAAQIVWGNAIKDFNRFETQEFSTIEWSTRIQFGALILPFPLRINDSELGFGSAFRRVLRSDPDAALTRADELKNETFRSTSYVEIVTVSLENPPKNWSSRPSPTSPKPAVNGHP